MIKKQLMTLLNRYTFAFFSCLSSWTYAAHFPFEPPQNFKLEAKYIGLHHPVTTSNWLAQLYFDQGLTFVYAFNHDAAYWSFLKASQADAELAMAYWGMALVLGPNINMEMKEQQAQVAYENIQKAQQLASKASKEEQEYIQALSQRYSKDPNQDAKQLAIAYSDAMRKLTQQYPDDLDAAVLFAESLLDVNPWNQWSADGKPLNGTMEAVNTLQSVIKRNPDHLGANHYYVHVIEASSQPEIALMAANRLKTLLPSSGHVLHMPSHIYLLVGDYLQAARSNEAAAAADREYIREYGMNGIYPLHYLSHNLYFLSRSYTMLGNFQAALSAAQELVDFYVPHFEHMPDSEYYASAVLTVLLTFHQWSDVLKVPPPDEKLKITSIIWHFSRAVAFAALGDIARSIKEQNIFLREKEQLPKETAFGYNRFDQILRIAENCLAAKLAEAKKEPDQAVEFLKNAIVEQDALRYNEPPDWFFPVREALGGLLLRNEKYAEAEKLFREDLEKHPRNGRSLFGLKECLRAQNKQTDYYWVNQEFQKAWMHSTISLNSKDL